MMGKEEFRATAMIYGADLARWPAGLRAKAMSLTAEPWAVALLADLADLEADLAAADVDAPTPDRVGRAIAGTLDRVTARPRLSPGRLLAWVAAGAGGLAASAAFGMVLALYGPLAPPTLDPISFLIEAGDLALPGLGG
ncbi:hypothetical protein [Pleomorphomonas sp. JP5]|uniref:hypothetical protein n=1 Tax=Pleomorphomonas sp. JP5 TaxID=2942998 RepID=UPI002043D317|nr:hypothetical protein [Pleomorphomonas sp. JP5]MCM5557689.1 hypothetical protein [Pleomorphomonas sp. JP5]